MDIDAAVHDADIEVEPEPVGLPPSSSLSSSSSASPWDGFVNGPENALATASVLALAAGGEASLGLSPLLVHGPSGVGKTRLLTALVDETLRRRPESAVAHLEAEAFAAACAEAASAGGGTGGMAGGWSDLRDRFRGLDLFVLDDLHALERAPLALNELVHTLDALEATGGRVAVSARIGPSHWTSTDGSSSSPRSRSRSRSRSVWPPRLINRLIGGLSVRVDPPGLDARRRFVHQRARFLNLTLAAEAVEALAEAGDGYRTLDGWLARLGLLTRLGGQSRPRSRSGSGSGTIDPPARRVLGVDDVRAILTENDDETHHDHAANPGPGSGSGSGSGSGMITIEHIARAVAARFGVKLSDLRGASRRAALAGPRHLAMHLARTGTGRSYQAIGAYFGGRDPATVRHACRAAAARISADPALASAVASIRVR